jgi:elongation factor 1-alpha
MEGKKQVASVVFIGDEGSGKSTVVGHLLYRLHPDISALERVEKEATEKGMPGCKFAWLINRLPKERELGHTINVSYHCLETETVSFTLFDIPGRRKYAGNMIAGTSCADIAVLIVSAQRGEFEAGMGRFGQTKEHALIAFTMGIKELIVGVNKIDTCNPLWAQDRYEEIQRELSIYLVKVGYQRFKVSFVPISSWHGFKLTESCSVLQWYTGPNLLQALTALSLPVRQYDQPLILSVLDVYRIPGIGTVAVGKVHTGVLAYNSSISFLPVAKSTSVLSIESHNKQLKQANPGTFIGFAPRYIGSREIYRGLVVTNSSSSSKYTIITAQVVVLFHPKAICVGYKATLYCHTAKTLCKLAAFKAKIDKRTAGIIEESPVSVTTGDTFICVFHLEEPIYVAKYTKYPHFARFLLRDMGVTVAVGIIKEIELSGT